MSPNYVGSKRAGKDDRVKRKRRINLLQVNIEDAVLIFSEEGYIVALFW